MLQLRISTPAALTPRVLQALDDPAVSALALHQGASLRPVGDVVVADIARETANDLITRLHDLGVAREGSLLLDPVDSWLSREGLEAAERAPGSPADSVVWAQVTHHAYDEAELNWTYSSFLVLATLLAGVAVITHSEILVIGAMVLGPEFGVLAALALSIVRRRPRLLRTALRTLVVGFLVAIAVTTLVTLGGHALGWVSRADIARGQGALAFIYSPNRWSVAVSVIAGAAGVLSLTSDRIGGLSGVFISVTTIPAAGNIAVATALGVWGQVGGSALQLVINMAGMVLAGWVTLLVQQVVWSRVSARRARALGLVSDA